MRKSPNNLIYRSALGLAILGSLLLIWLSLGVGIIGADGDPANRMYFAVIVTGIIGAVLARLRPLAMSRTLSAMAFVQALIAAIAVIGKLGLPWSGPAELVILNGFFIAMFSASAWLFRRSAKPETDAGAPVRA